MAANRSFDRHPVLWITGIALLAMIVTLALIPRNLRAHIADAFAGIGGGRLSFVVGGPSEASHNHSASGNHKKGGEDRSAESSLETSQYWPADGWSPAAALARAAFMGVDSLERNPFLPAAGLPNNSRADSDSASGGWPGQQHSDGVTGGNSAGAPAAAGGGAGGAVFPGSPADTTKRTDLTGLHDSESRGGLSLTGMKLGVSGSAGLDWQGASDKPLSAVKALVTGGNDLFGDGFTDQVVEAPILPSASGSKGKAPASGNSWVSGQQGKVLPALAASGVTNKGEPIVGHKSVRNPHALNEISASDLSNISNIPQSDDIIGGLEAVPEPTASKLFVTALLGIVILKLRSTRKA